MQALASMGKPGYGRKCSLWGAYYTHSVTGPSGTAGKGPSDRACDLLYLVARQLK